MRRTYRDKRIGGAVSCAVEQLEARIVMASVPAGFTDAQLVSNLNSPTSMEIAPDGRIFFTEQSGAVRIIKDGQLLATPFATVSTNSQAERDCSA